MNHAPRSRLVPVGVEPLDDSSRHFVPRALPDRQLDDDRTGRGEQDLPSTEPDGPTNESLARIRDSVVSGLRLLEDQKQKTPLDARVPEPVVVLLSKDKPTEPARGAAPSDVFAPLGARERIVDEEAATPRDRPFRHIDHDKPTDLDAHRAPATLTMQGVDPQRHLLEATEPLSRTPQERESEKERLLVHSVYDTERAYHALKDADAARGAHISSLRDHLKNTETFSERDLVLAVHAREKRALASAPPELRNGREDRVMAIGLVAREVDDSYRERMKALKEELIGELGVLPPDKRDAVFADFETFAERDSANDSNYCRRELNRALKQEPELHRAYVYALALDKQRPRIAGEQAPAAEDSSSARRRA